jgi:hypothetical protein
MIRIPLSDLYRVQYLICRKFPLYRQLKHIKGIETYKRELLAKPPEELRTLYEQEQEKEQHELQNANADFTHWSKAALWTLDEGVALSFGKAPEIVNWELVKEFVHISPFAFKYDGVRDLALRAKACGLLSDPELPGVFLAWARRTEIDLPSELVEQVEARGVVIADWKDMFDKLKAEYDKYVAAAEKLFAANGGKIAELTQERDTLKQKLEAIQSTERKLGDAPLHGLERDSLLKMILGMAMFAYDYKPGSSRNTATGENRNSISASLQQQGLPLDADTVRKLIKEAETRFKDLIPNPQKP